MADLSGAELPSRRELADRLTKLEQLLKPRGKGRVDPAVLDKGKLTKLLSSVEVAPESYPAGSLPNSGLSEAASYLRDVGEHCRALNGAGQVYTTGVLASLGLPTEDYDVSATSNPMHDTAASNWLITVRRSGIYLAVAQFTSVVGGYAWQGSIVMNGGTIIARQTWNALDWSVAAPPQFIQKGGTFEFTLLQNSGVNQNAFGSLSVSRIGDIVNDRPINS